jgi:hypothetical protein
MTENKVLCLKSNIPNAGLGLFANIDFLGGQFKTNYQGDKMHISKYNQNNNYALVVNDEVIIGYDAFTDSKNAAQFINDIAQISDEKDIDQYIMSINNTNVFIVNDNDNYFAIAIKNIKKEEELYFHYGLNYWISKNNIKLSKETKKNYLELEQNESDNYLQQNDMFA